MTDERDEVIERVREILREPPVVDASAKARLLVAVAAERERTPAPGARLHAATMSAAAAGLLAAGLLVGWFGWSAFRPEPTGAAPRAVASAAHGNVAVPATLAANEPNALQPVQLVFRAPAAHRVSVVGDFTEWDAHQAPMTRDSASGLWSVTLALRPGRHVYAFLVDDTSWVQDPRALEARDEDFGRPGSVLLVGRP